MHAWDVRIASRPMNVDRGNVHINLRHMNVDRRNAHIDFIHSGKCRPLVGQLSRVRSLRRARDQHWRSLCVRSRPRARRCNHNGALANDQLGSHWRWNALLACCFYW